MFVFLQSWRATLIPAIAVPVVLLVRHGQASFGADDYDVLSDLGREQAQLAAGEVARRGLRDPVLVCGSLRRQRDTALLLGLGEPRTELGVQPEIFRWTDGSASSVECEFGGGRLKNWHLERPSTDATDAAP